MAKMSRRRGQPCNKSKHADLEKLSPFLFQKSRQLHQAVV